MDGSEIATAPGSEPHNLPAPPLCEPDRGGASTSGENGAIVKNTHPSYLLKTGHNSYQVYTWSESHGMYRQSMASYTYDQARAYVGAGNCRYRLTPEKCPCSTHAQIHEDQLAYDEMCREMA